MKLHIRIAVYVSIILGVLITTIVMWKQLSGKNTIEERWNILINNKEPEVEIDYVNGLVNIATSKNGYWKIIGIDKNEESVNMLNYQGTLDSIAFINIIFYWEDEFFEGKGWIPLKKGNIYQFMRDK